MINNILDLLSSVRFDSYKSFSGNGPFCMELGQNITLIIGRNNCGKSSLIDIVETIVNKPVTKKLPDGMEGVNISFRLDESHLEYGFQKNRSTSRIGNEFNFATQFLDKDFTIKFDGKEYYPSRDQEDTRVFLGVDSKQKKDGILSNWETVARIYGSEVDTAKLFRINAERDIVPENEYESEKVDSYGNGATNLIRRFINIDSKDESIVERTILDELNKIMAPDAHYSAIRVQQVRENKKDEYLWEIFLEENGHRYALSKSGSGLKTVLLILINLYLLPKTGIYRDGDICYAFEEIENNLHPALQRRVFDYLYHYAVEKNIKILITSHSHIAINAFYANNKAKLYHVFKNNGVSELEPISGGAQCGEILDDIGAKASDLFQANGIIWVEGPSDRIYILHWLKTLTNFQYEEGHHFQFVYYGGRLLSHYEAADQERNTAGLINILTANRNAAIVIDSDRKSSNSRINETKKRIQKEFAENNLFCWVTKGREIENYLPEEAVNMAYGADLQQIGLYEDFKDYISSKDRYFERHKVETARKICAYSTMDNLEKILDLKKRVDQLYMEIKGWNCDEIGI